MAYNLKLGMMATTTMIGTAVAFTKTQTKDIRENLKSGKAKIQAYSERWEGSQKKGKEANYTDTFEQMMMWK